VSDPQLFGIRHKENMDGCLAKALEGWNQPSVAEVREIILGTNWGHDCPFSPNLRTMQTKG
jgi:hypothetical protein